MNIDIHTVTVTGSDVSVQQPLGGVFATHTVDITDIKHY